jgi:peroxiredoxin
MNHFLSLFYKTVLIFILSLSVYAQEGKNMKHSTQADIPTSADAICPLLVGSKIPSMTLRTSDGGEFALNAALAQKPTVLIFYRGGWCPYCNIHLSRLQEVEPQLLQLGYQILAISADRPEKLYKSLGKKHLDYILLSDSSMECAQAFGIAFRVDDKTIDKYKRYNMDLEEASGQKHHLLPVPAAFIVGTDGVIKFKYVNPNYKVRVDPDVLLAMARTALK